jgi:hypothetical protein
LGEVGVVIGPGRSLQPVILVPQPFAHDAVGEFRVGIAITQANLKLGGRAVGHIDLGIPVDLDKDVVGFILQVHRLGKDGVDRDDGRAVVEFSKTIIREPDFGGFFGVEQAAAVAGTDDGALGPTGDVQPGFPGGLT